MANNASLNEYFDELHNLLLTHNNRVNSYEDIVNAPFKNKLYTTNIDLGIIVLTLLESKGKTVDRIAVSDTEPARWAVRMTPVPFEEIKIPIDTPENIISRAVRTNRPQKTSDWKQLFIPVLSSEAARFTQAGAGIACSYVYPLTSVNQKGALIYSFYQPPDQISSDHKSFMRKYTQLVSNAFDS